MPVLIALIVIFAMALGSSAGAQTVPIPRPRPLMGASPPGPRSAPAEHELPSACRLRLTGNLAVASPLPPIDAPEGCGGDDLLQLEAVVLPNSSRIAIMPPAIVRCTLAEEIVRWVREDVATAARALDAPLRSIENYASYDCRGRNRIAGAKLSEHGKANALDVRSLKLANGTVVHLTDPHVPAHLRQSLRTSACARFTTVLGPGSDGYHEYHIHVDLAERRNGHRMCQWDVLEPSEESAGAAVHIGPHKTTTAPPRPVR